jgi:triosephosphate isomerase
MLAIINFKAYANSIGLNAVRLARVCERITKRERANIAVAVQPADILAVAGHVGIPVLAQHVDAIEFGAKTGWILPESAQQMGAVGSLINHSEHRIPLQQINATIKRLKELGMLSVCCANTPSMAAKIARFKPDIIAIEPPELIGGNVAVSQAKPQIITQTTHKIKSIPILCGAGVKSKDDVSKAVHLGAKGILVASGVTNARNPGKALTDLVRGLK